MASKQDIYVRVGHTTATITAPNHPAQRVFAEVSVPFDKSANTSDITFKTRPDTYDNQGREVRFNAGPLSGGIII